MKDFTLCENSGDKVQIFDIKQETFPLAMISGEGGGNVMQVSFRLIGRRIHEIRKERDLSQMDLADKTGLSVSYVSMIENGRRKVSLDTLICIANILGVTVDELLNGNQMYNPTEYQTDMDLLLEDCSNYEKRIIYELVKAVKTILRDNYELSKASTIR